MLKGEVHTIPIRAAQSCSPSCSDKHTPQLKDREHSEGEEQYNKVFGLWPKFQDSVFKNYHYFFKGAFPCEIKSEIFRHLSCFVPLIITFMCVYEALPVGAIALVLTVYLSLRTGWGMYTQDSVTMKHYSKMIYKLRLLSVSFFMMKEKGAYTLWHGVCSSSRKERKNTVSIVSTLV